MLSKQVKERRRWNRVRAIRWCDRRMRLQDKAVIQHVFSILDPRRFITNDTRIMAAMISVYIDPDEVAHIKPPVTPHPLTFGRSSFRPELPASKVPSKPLVIYPSHVHFTPALLQQCWDIRTKVAQDVGY